MKRTILIVALALAITMIMVCLIACGKSEKSHSEGLKEGTYQLKEVDGNSAELFDEVKDEVILEISGKNKGNIIIKGVPRIELTFNENDGKVIMDDLEIPYTTQGNTITIEDPNGKMVFKMQ